MSRDVRVGIAIVLAAAGLRLWAVGFGLPLLLKPDENRMVEVAYAFGDARFQHWFLVYPHLLFFVEWALFMAVFALGWASGIFSNFKAFRVWRHGSPHLLHLVSRLPVVAAGALTTAALQGLGTRAGGPRVGLLAALFLSVCPCHVKESMYFSVDAPMVLLSVLSLWLALEAVERDRPRLLWAAGLVGGLAAGTKYPAAVLAVPLTVAWGLARARAGWSFGHLVTCGGAMIGTFVMSTPYLLTHPRALAEEMGVLSARLGVPHSGIDLGPGWLYHLTVSMPEGFTGPILAGGLAGLLVWGRRGNGLVLTTYLAACYLTFARSCTVFQRYALPLAPVFCLFAARAYLALAGRLVERLGSAGRAAGCLLIAGAVAVPAARSLAYVEFLAREDTRASARRWLEEHVPPGTRLAMIGCAWVDIQAEKDPDQEDPFRPERHAYLRLGRSLALSRFLPARTYHVTYAPDLAAARAAGCAVAVVADHPWHPQMRLADHIRAEVAAAGTLAWSVDPTRPGAAPARYDEQDAWLVPTSGFESLTEPGPRVWIYRLR